MRALAAVFIGLLVPASAHAASAGVDDKTIHITYAASKSEEVRLLPRDDGSYLVRVRRAAGVSITPGTQCAVNRPRELRCSGPVERITVAMRGRRLSTFQAQQLAVPLQVVGGDEPDLVLIGDSIRRVAGSRAPVDVRTGGGKDSIIINGTAGVDYTADGGPGRDNLEGIRATGAGLPSFTLRGGSGPDRLVGDDGADVLDGGADNDDLDGRGGADTLVGGDGTDTAFFTAPPSDQPRLTVTLDGERNDGQPGQNALVSPDVENVTLRSPYEGPVPGGNTLVGNDGPNKLVGAGTMRGLGGNDVLYAVGDAPNDFDGGDGDDRISARVFDAFLGQVAGADNIACGAGDDVLLTDAKDPRPEDCEHFDLGLRVTAPSARVDRNGRALVRVTCADIVPCSVSNITLVYKRHVASVYTRILRHRVLQPGQSATYPVQLNRWLARPGRFRRLTVSASPGGLAGGLLAGYPRVITLIRAR